jgi:hypothetical protein
LKLPEDVIIPDEKLTQYLLIHRQWDDKSKYLAQAGFTLNNPDDLKKALITLAATSETVQDRTNEYGEVLHTDGVLTGSGGRELPVTVIWIRWHLDGSIHFVTLRPRKEK